MRTEVLFRSGIAVALTACLFVSCVDDKYDLSDVDMTIGASVDLWLPESSTAPVELASFMNLGDNGLVDTVFVESLGKTIFYAHSNGWFDLTIPYVMNGKVDYSVSTPLVEIGKLPDFLDGEDICLDLVNPVVIANVECNIPDGTLATDFNVKSYKYGKEVGRCDVNALSFTSGETDTYISAEKVDNIPSDILGMPFGQLSWLQLKNGNSFSDILKTVPEQLQFEVTGLEGNGFAPIPQKVDATVHVGLQLYAPLCIGKDLSMTYVTEQRGWAEEYGDDISDVSGLTCIRLHAIIENNAPVDAELEITPVDVDGNVIDELPAFVKPVSTNPNGTVIDYDLKANSSRHSLMDFITGNNGAPVIDGIKVVCRLKTNPSHIGEYLTTEAAVQMKNMRIGVMGNVSYDAN
ncbi:MAG: hypothetical protein K2J00_01075 [Bacteroidaceae bacterium]|nr:hypothetical protein [Bacteroidaceae bacterium]